MKESSTFSAVAPERVELSRPEGPGILNPIFAPKIPGSQQKDGRIGSPGDTSSRVGRAIPSKSPRWYNCNGYRARFERHPDGRRRTILEHREVMGAMLGRPLRSDEHVHHRDGDRSNNHPSNLELLTASEHASRHHATGLTMVALTCVRCGVGFERPLKDERGNRKAGKSGPFCGKSCAGKWSREKQIAAGQVNLRAGDHCAHVLTHTLATASDGGGS